MTAGRTLVIGDAVLDVRAAPRHPIRPGSDVPADITLGPGGQGANVAVRLARRGVPVDLACALGDDPAGTLLRQALVAEGVRLVELEAAAATGAVVVLAGSAGERTMLSQRTAVSAVASALDAGTPDWIVLSGYVLTEPGADGLVGLAKGMAHRVILGCALREEDHAPWSSRAAALRPDVLVLNRQEADALARIPRATVLLVTDAGGAEAHIGGQVLHVRGTSEPDAVDTTGAGDAFAAAVVAHLRERPWPPSHETLTAAVSEGVALAAQVTRVTGAQARVPLEMGATLR